MSETTAIAIRGLGHAYGAGAARRDVLRAVDLTVSRGEVVVLSGASGAGKTTLLTLCAALRSVQEGDARVLGFDLRDLDARRQRELRSVIGVVFQSHHLLEALTAGQNVLMSLLGRVPTRDAMRLAESALTLLGLASRIDARPGALSGGEQQRVAVARALVRNPPLILADEPTASLDDRSAVIVVDALKAAARRWGAAVLVATHDPRVFGAADRRVHLADGALVEEPSPQSRRLHVVGR